MADIFISYAKADRSRVQLLASMLEAEGWTVWWDTSLLAGDDFRDEIMKELARARAVIVLWTETSVVSKWVRSEAGRALADGKLIPVKAAQLGYKDIPPPFDGAHTEDLDNTIQIKAAIVAQLSKPAVVASGWWLATRELRFQALTWFGIIGGALTLFSGLAALLHLADWARFVVEHWQMWTQAWWGWVFGWFEIPVPKGWGPVLTTVVFLVGIAVGQLVQNRVQTDQGARFALTVRHSALIAGLMLAYMFASSFLSLFAVYKGFFVPGWLVPGLQLLSFWLFPIAAIVAAAVDRKAVLGNIGAQILIVSILVIAPNMGSSGSTLEDPQYVSIFLLFWLLPAITLAIAPARPLLRRHVFLLIGVGILIGLNKVSKLALSLKPLV